jgi:hypothetical protein
MVKRYAEWIVRLRWLIIIATLLAVGALASGGRFLAFTNDYRVFFSDENPQLTAFENLQDTYTKNDNILIMLQPKGGDVFTQQVLQAVVELTEQGWQVPYSTRVDSISNFQHTSAEGDDMLVEDLVYQPDTLDADGLARIRDIATTEPRLVNKLVSPSGHVTGVNITVETPGVDPNAELPEVIDFARAMLADFEARYPDIDFYYTGVVVMNQAFPEATKTDMQTLIPAAFGIIIAGLLIFLRSFVGTIATVLVILMSIVTAMGSAGWLGIALTPPSASAPTLILTLAVADCVHLLVSMLHEMRMGRDKRAAVVEALRINFNPIFLTSLTTAIGFLSMNFSDAPPFRDLGNITAMGVAYAFVLAVTFLPALMCVLPVRIRVRAEDEVTRMDHFASFVINQRKPLLIGMSVVIVALVALVPKNEINDVFVEYFDDSVLFRQHADHITDELSGMYFIDYSLDSGESSGISEPDFLNKLQAFESWLKAQPEVMHVNAYSEVMRKLNQNMHADDPSWYRLPDERELAAQYLLLYEMSLPYGLDLNNQINVDKSATRVNVTIQTLSTSQVYAFEDRVAAWFDENAPALKTEGASPTVMFSHIAQRNIASMLGGTTLAIVLISGVLMVALRSLKYGLISLLPNLVPAGMGFGLWYLLVGEVGLAVSVVAAMTLGIVVDDTIHFLSKYLRARREKGLDAREAVRYAFHTVGVALTVTTIVLTAGFLMLATSAFEINSSMGLLTAVTITIALIVDFLFLPPLLIMIEEKKS